MREFLDKHREKITGTLSCFDRIIFRGHLQTLTYPRGLEVYLDAHGVLLKHFKEFAQEQAERLKKHAQTVAKRAGRPYRYLRFRTRKEDQAREIIHRDGIEEGLVCVFSAVEPCRSFEVVGGKRRPRLKAAWRKCLHLYFYWLDPKLGLLHFRIQTWFPFTVQVYINGHDWLARKMDQAGLEYELVDNAFCRLEDPDRAQRMANRFPRLKWTRILDKLATRFNPLLPALRRYFRDGQGYHWVTDQGEYATDIMFTDPEALRGLYPRLLWYAIRFFSAEDILTFLGKRIHGYEGQLLTDLKKRRSGTRIKHRIKRNWIKMYDKYGLVLRVETVINHPYDFKVRRPGKRNGEWVMGWFPMAKKVGNLYRYAEISRKANERYLSALAVVDDPEPAQRDLLGIAERVRHNARTVRAINPASRTDITLLTTVIRGEFTLAGFRNSDIRSLLFRKPRNQEEERRNASRTSRLLKLLHLHRIIKKIPRSRRWRVTSLGLRVIPRFLQLHEPPDEEALAMAT